MEWVAGVAVFVVLAVCLRCVVRQMQEAAQKYRDAITRDEIESVLTWLENQKKQPHG